MSLLPCSCVSCSTDLFLWYSAELSLLASHMFVAELLDICELMLLFGNISVLL